MEPQNHGAVGLGFDDLAGVPLLLGDQRACRCLWFSKILVRNGLKTSRQVPCQVDRQALIGYNKALCGAVKNPGSGTILPYPGGDVRFEVCRGIDPP